MKCPSFAAMKPCSPATFSLRNRRSIADDDSNLSADGSNANQLLFAATSIASVLLLPFATSSGFNIPRGMNDSVESTKQSSAP